MPSYTSGYPGSRDAHNYVVVEGSHFLSVHRLLFTLPTYPTVISARAGH